MKITGNGSLFSVLKHKSGNPGKRFNGGQYRLFFPDTQRVQGCPNRMFLVIDASRDPM